MGLLVKGQWQDQWYDTDSNDGEFVREESGFRNWITVDGSPGPTGSGGFVAESGRYHLYISHACPWAHRTMIFRQIKALEKHISVTVVGPDMLEQGWEITEQADPLHSACYLHEIYTRAVPDYTGRVTVPVLWDKQQDCIVNNESSEIIRMFNHAFDDITGNADDYYPAALADGIDAVNQRIYEHINNGVYRCGFATSQNAYEKAFHRLFETLDWVENRLANQRYLLGTVVTEADWRLLTTLLRFDVVYYGHFKCNRQQIADYPNLSHYLRELYQWPGVAGTVHFDHIIHHYYHSQRAVNPTGIVPAGPDLNGTRLDLDLPHDRDRLPAS